MEKILNEYSQLAMQYGREYSQFAIGKGKEIEIILRTSKAFENIPKQYHDQCIIGMIVFAIVIVPLLISLIFRKSSSTKSSPFSQSSTPTKKNKSKNTNSTPNKSTPNKNNNNRQTPIKSPNNKQQQQNQTPIKSPNNKQQQQNQTPIKSPKSIVKYAYPENDDDDDYFEEEEQPLKAIEENKNKQPLKSKTPSKKNKLDMCFSPPADATRKRVPVSRFAMDISNSKTKTKK